MKKCVAAISLTAGLSIIAAPAFAQTTGSIGGGYTSFDVDGHELDAYNLNGSVTIPMSGSLGIQFDGAFTEMSDDGFIDDQIVAGTAHLFTRSDSQAWGGYVSLADAGGLSALGAGAEYAKFFSRSTLVVTGGYGKAQSYDLELYNLNAEYRFFVTDNLRFDFGVGANRMDYGYGFDLDTASAVAGVEYRFANSPVSLSGSYERQDLDGENVDIFGVSLKWDFGTASLKARDRKGATFSAAPINNMLTWGF